MPSDSNHLVTQLLQSYASGDEAVLDQLMPMVYQDLRLLAQRSLRQERNEHTLQATALAHEAYLRLIDQRNVDWRDRQHFLAIAAQQIRRILVDHARAKNSNKRGGGSDRITLSDLPEQEHGSRIELMALDDAMQRLAQISETQCRIVELRYFGGLTLEDIAEVLGIGKRSVSREWNCAKAWLYHELTK